MLMDSGYCKLGVIDKIHEGAALVVIYLVAAICSRPHARLVSADYIYKNITKAWNDGSNTKKNPSSPTLYPHSFCLVQEIDSRTSNLITPAPFTLRRFTAVSSSKEEGVRYLYLDYDLVSSCLCLAAVSTYRCQNNSHVRATYLLYIKLLFYYTQKIRT